MILEICVKGFVGRVLFFDTENGPQKMEGWEPMV